MTESIGKTSEGETTLEHEKKLSPSRLFSPVWDELAVAFIFVSVVMLYWPVRGYEFVGFDDPQYVAVNRQVAQGLHWTTFKWAFCSETVGLWQPLTMLSFLADASLHGVHPGPMHLENVFLHAISSVGWYVLLRGMTGRAGPAFFAAALFALHPARVESVAWITERKDVLSMLMLVLSLLAYWRYTERAGWISLAWYLASFCLFALALMSKAMMVSQPLIMLILDVWPLGRTRWFGQANQSQTIFMSAADSAKKTVNSPQRITASRGETNAERDEINSLRSSRFETPRASIVNSSALRVSRAEMYFRGGLGGLLPLVVEKIPFFVLSVASSVVALIAQRLIGARPGFQVISLYDRLATCIVGYARYLGTMFWPVNLAVLYPFQFNLPLITLISAGALLGLITLGAIRVRKQKPYLLLGWMWFILAMVPVSGLFQSGDQALADRFSYLPSMGLTIACVWFVADLKSKWLRWIGASCGGLAVILCMVLTRDYLPCWHDSIRLFTQAAAVNGKTPDWNIEQHLADAYAQTGRPDLAIDHYTLSLQGNPGNAHTQSNLATLLMRGFPELALPHYKAAVDATPDDPVAHHDYGVCLKRLKQDALAEEQFKIAERLSAAGPK